MNYPKTYYANASLAAAAASAPDSLQLMTVAYTRNLPVAGAAPAIKQSIVSVDLQIECKLKRQNLQQCWFDRLYQRHRNQLM